MIRPDGTYRSQQRFGLYRWHIMDPVRFAKDLKVTIQDLGWVSIEKDTAKYLSRHDDFASVAYWYQKSPCLDVRTLPPADELKTT